MKGPSKIYGRQPLKDFTWSILDFFFVSYVVQRAFYYFVDGLILSNITFSTMNIKFLQY